MKRMEVIIQTWSDNKRPEFEGGLFVEDGVVRVTQNYQFKTKLVKDLEYWKTRRDNAVSLKARARRVAKVVMTQNQKEKRVIRCRISTTTIT